MTQERDAPREREALQKGLGDTFKRLQNVYGVLSSTTGEMPGAAASSPGTAWEDAVSQLRLALAVRGRSDPARLLPPKLDAEARLRALDAVARESDTGGSTGLWLLTDAARKHVLENAPRTLITQALRSAPPNDGVTRALRFMLAPEKGSIDELSSADLRNLVALGPVAAHLAKAPPSPETLRWQLRRKTRLETYDATVAAGFVGRDTELHRLLDFATTADRLQLESYFVWGTGGLGKSTLLAAALQQMVRTDVPGAPVVAHLDFDRSDLDFKNSLALSTEVLSQAGLADADADIHLQARCEELRLYGRQVLERNLSSQESAHQETRSLLYSALEWMRDQQRPLVLVLDTFEQVDGGGESALWSIRTWLRDFIEQTRVPWVRLLVAGRSHPVESGAETAIVADSAARLMELEELARDPAVRFLTDGGIPNATAGALYDALGGNPLVLRLVRDLGSQERGATALSEVATKVRQGQIPTTLIQGVLYDRFLKHIPDERARAYAHPGLVLPQITVELIRNILAPLNDEREMDDSAARAIFDGLAAASWLVQREGDSLRQRRDVRSLMLRLMESDPARAADVRRVRVAAALYHHGREELTHRASLAYHLLMGVASRDDLHLLDGMDLRGCGEFLRRYRDDLPEIAQTFVSALDFEQVGPQAGARRRVLRDVDVPAERAQQHLPNDLWASYIAGDGWGGGEGDRLVDRVDPLIALGLWTKRPVGPTGCPPTFVLQALADTGEWDSEAADLDVLVHGLALQKGKLTTPTSLSRLYWVTRLALLSMPSGFAGETLPTFAESLVAMLRDVLGSGDARRILTALPALCSVLEALSRGNLQIVPPDYFTRERKSSGSGRSLLQHAIHREQAGQWLSGFDELVTLQRDFAERVKPMLLAADEVRPDGSPDAAQVVVDVPRDTLTDLLERTARVIGELQGKPIGDTIKAMAALQKPLFVRAHAPTTPEEQAGVALLLRGQLGELHRPARQALVEAFAGVTPGTLREYITRVAHHLTVLPLDLEPETFVRRAREDAAGSFLNLVQYADRARVLESVLTDACAFVTQSPKLARVLTTLGVWDRALTGGVSSDWWAGETPEQRATRCGDTATAATRRENREKFMTASSSTPGLSTTGRPQTSHLSPTRLTAWLRKIEKRDPTLHAELAEKLARRTPLTTEGTAAPEGLAGAARPRGDMVLETIVREGRPALLIQDNRITALDPGADEQSREMIMRLMAAAPTLQTAIPLVGRIDVANFAGPIDFVGTGWLVDTDIVVTNRHVAELIARNDGGTYTFRPGRFGDPLQVRVDYRRESANPATESVEVERVVWIEPDSRKADIAFLKVRARTASATGAHLNAIPLADTDAAPGTAVAVIGYPARAPAHIIPDQAWMDRIYGGEYDVKRIAPGLMDDPSRGWTTHDCTTLGGNSGSAVIEMARGTAVALHFAGLYMIENYAVPASTIRRYLRERPWQGSTRGNGAAGPAHSEVTPATPVLQASAAPIAAPANGAHLSVTVPVTITVAIGQPTSPAVGPAVVATTPAAAVDVKTAARSLYDAQQGDGVLAVRPGFLVRDGKLTHERCLVIAAHPERVEQVQERAPASWAGIPVTVRPASIDEQLGVTAIVPEAVTSVQYDDDNRTGSGFSFNWVDEPMKLRLHVGPERSWSVLSDFLSGAQQELVSSIYEFHAAHVAGAIEQELDEGAKVTLVMAHQSRDPKDDDIPAGDFDRSDTFGRWESSFGNRFERIVVPVGTNGLVANSYHIKVTVRDQRSFWLSSGNWKSSSQPEIPEQDFNDPRRATQAGNREWHVVAHNETLARRLRNHIRADFDRSRELGGQPEAVEEIIMVDVPLAALEDIELEAPARSILEPLDVDRRVRVKPLLTPDREGAVYSKAVLRLIRSAQSSLLFQIPYITVKANTTGFLAQLVDALVEKSKTLNDFRLILRSDSGDFWENLEQLQDRGLDIGLVRRLGKTHTKGMIVDGERVLVGSHNWSSTGVTLNRDASLIFDDREIAEYYGKAFELDWARAQELRFDEAPVIEAPRIATTAQPPPGFKRITLSEFLEG